MPRIVLKPNSAEYADTQKTASGPACEMPGCVHTAEYKAPKHRDLRDYYHFCLDHVKEYNRAWNFFSGMSDADIQAQMEREFYGDRPTWRFANHGETAEDYLRRKAWQSYSFDEEPPKSGRERFEEREAPPPPQANTPEMEALAIMGLEPPVDLDDIKKRYKELAKKYHPDLNNGCQKSEDLLKKVNMSYTILKLAYGEYEKLKRKESS